MSIPVTQIKTKKPRLFSQSSCWFITVIAPMLCTMLLLVGTMSACTFSPKKTSTAVEQEADQQLSTDKLPKLALSENLLYELLLTDIAAQRGHLNAALSSISRTALRSQDPRLVSRATVLALRTQHYNKALEFARLWSRIDPNSQAATEAEARSLLALDRGDDAYTQFSKLIEQSKDDLSTVYQRIAVIFTDHPNKKNNLALLDRLISIHPRVAESYFAKAYLADRLGQTEVVLQASEQALSLRPDWENAAMAKVSALSRLDRWEEIEPYCDKFLAKNPKAVQFRLSYGRLLTDRNKLSKALKQFEKITKQESDHADALYAAGILSIQTEKYANAKKYLLRHLNLQPDNQQTLLFLGDVSGKLKQVDQAIDYYQGITHPQHRFEAQMHLSALMAENGDVEAGLAYLRNLDSATDEQRIRIVLNQEQMLRQAKRPWEAKTLLDQALAEQPDDTGLRYARGLLAAQLDLIDLHEQDLRQLIAKEPDNAHAHNALGYTLADNNTRLHEALALIQKALELRPDDPFIMDSMGWVQYRLGEHQLAIDYLRNALAVREDPEISAHLGEVLWAMGDQRQARTVWRRALKLAPDNQILLDVLKKFQQ